MQRHKQLVLRVLYLVLLITKHLIYLRMHSIRVVWHTKIHLLHLLRDVRLLALMHFLSRLGIIAGFRPVMGRLAVNNLVRD